jgi:hypothetical protein
MAQIFSNEWQRSVRQRHIEQLRSIPFETDEKVIRDGTDITVNGLTPEEYADMVRGWIAAIHPQTQDAINSSKSCASSFIDSLRLTQTYHRGVHWVRIVICSLTNLI